MNYFENCLKCNHQCGEFIASNICDKNYLEWEKQVKECLKLELKTIDKQK